MSLSGTLSVGRTALATHQVALQVTSNNIANVNTPGYTRQVAKLGTLPEHQIKPGQYVGTGVEVDSITRAIDESLNGRVRSSIADGESAGVLKQWLGRVEAAYNELSDEDLSSRMSKFFNSWSNLANKPADVGLRQIVMQAGDSVAGWMKDLRTGLSGLSGDVNERISALVNAADGLANQVANLNNQIVRAEAGTGGTANGLRDQRDESLRQLSELVNIESREQEDGSVSVYVNSEPLVLGSDTQGVGLRQEVIDGEVIRTVIFKNNDGEMNVTAGQLGGLNTVKSTIDDNIEKLDKLANNLIFELNKLHSAGQGLEGRQSIQSTFIVDDPAAALNSEEADLKFAATNGSFVVHVKNKQTGLTTSTLVQVDLDGVGGNDTSLNTLATSIDSIANINASSTAGRLNINTDSDAVEISFSQDSSGILAAIGVNTFFTGSDAGDIAVNSQLKATPTLLAAAKNGEPADNQTALAISRLESQAMAGLNNVSLKDTYAGMVNDIAARAATAQSDAEAADSIRETLIAQKEAFSGVSLDEEAVNLIRSQRAFQGAAKIISTVDEMLQTMLGLVR